MSVVVIGERKTDSLFCRIGIWIWTWKVVDSLHKDIISQHRGVHAYGRVTELSRLLNADTEAAEVMLSGRVCQWVMVL